MNLRCKQCQISLRWRGRGKPPNLCKQCRVAQQKPYREAAREKKREKDEASKDS